MGLNHIKIVSMQVSTCPGSDFNTVTSVVSAVPEIRGMCMYAIHKWVNMLELRNDIIVCMKLGKSASEMCAVPKSHTKIKSFQLA